MRKPQLFRFIVILAIIAVTVWLNLPRRFRSDINLHFGRISFVRDLEPKLGLDLAGGVQVTLLADMKDIPVSDRAAALASTQEIVSRRIDLFGVSEPNIITLQDADNYQLIVELPGLTDTVQAVNLIGQTAKLDFRTPVYGPAATDSAELAIVDFALSDLTGADLKRAQPTFDQQNGQPVVSLEFNPEGAKKFSTLTTEYLKKPLAIFLDNQLIVAPTIQSVIPDGRAVISGSYTQDTARTLSIQLNAGALPVPITVISQQNIAATLGADSVQESLIAGLVGLALVVFFMIGNYGYLGVIASVGLAIYALITMSLYRLIPITLTLPGIAGFILSVGMAVDSNILVFERYKEELRAGRPWAAALELGFGRAWDSIRDANTATLITAFILFNPLQWGFLPTSGPVRGFALTLALGIFTSLFTGIFVTRTLLRLFYRGKTLSNKAVI